MLDILSITGPIYIAILLGYGATRRGLFSSDDLKVLGRFVLRLALPALVFDALSQRAMADIFNATYLSTYLFASLLSLAVGYAVSRYVLKEKAITSTFNSMGVSCSNSGFIGFPVLMLIVPDAAGVAFALNVIVENLVMIPLLLFMAEQSSGETSKKMFGTTMVRLLKNPLIIALFAGSIVSILQIPMPAMLSRTVSLFSLASGAISLFIIGGNLVGISMKGMKSQVYPVVAGKLLLHPISAMLVLYTLYALGMERLDAHLYQALVVMTAIPMMGTYTILAQAYGEERNASAIMLVTTTLSFFTLSGLLAIF